MADTTTRPAAVLFREQNTPSGQGLGFAQLNAEKSLHALTVDMIRLLDAQLQGCAHPDFPEGVRALLVDKDNKPRWTPQTAARVSDEWIADHFTVTGSSWANEANSLADLGLIRHRKGVTPA